MDFGRFRLSTTSRKNDDHAACRGTPPSCWWGSTPLTLGGSSAALGGRERPKPAEYGKTTRGRAHRGPCPSVSCPAPPTSPPARSVQLSWSQAGFSGLPAGLLPHPLRGAFLRFGPGLGAGGGWSGTVMTLSRDSLPPSPPAGPRGTTAGDLHPPLQMNSVVVWRQGPVSGPGRFGDLHLPDGTRA